MVGEPRRPAARRTKQYWGSYEGGRGIVLARSNNAEVDFSVFTYVRYLNQLALDETYTDAFGRTKTLDLRNDVQLQKVLLYFKGWFMDPRLSLRVLHLDSQYQPGAGGAGGRGRQPQLPLQ